MAASDWIAIVPTPIALDIFASGGHQGTLDLRQDNAEQLVVVSGYSKGNIRRHNSAGWLEDHYLNYGTINQDTGLWFRVEPELHAMGYYAVLRDGVLPIETFWENVQSGHRVLSPRGLSFALAFSAHPETGEPIWSGWWLSVDEARWCGVIEIDEIADILAPVAKAWPLDACAQERVVVVGAGSIGSAACESLCAYGVRDLVLVDPDRLQPHNIARHRVDRSQVGRYKVNALANKLRKRDAHVQVRPLPLDVIDDADQLRPVIAEATGVLVASDGVESRRVANYLACQAQVPAVFACVLDNGGYGEILRYIPHRTGCLLCARAALIDSGALDPEPALDRGYGTGSRHLAMTAVGGDLGLVGELAAKALVGTLLERRGFHDQRLPADHAIVGLRPGPRRAAPFDIEHAGEIRWHPTGPSRADCPCCGRP
jgi:molybdopterin/thiamine biosynthesis adenylyltransferase